MASPLTPSGASGAADERCVDAAGAVVSERSVTWQVDLRYIDRVLSFGSSTWYGGSEDVYVYDFVYTGIDTAWQFSSGTELLATDGVFTARVSTLGVVPNDSFSLEHE